MFCPCNCYCAHTSSMKGMIHCDEFIFSILFLIESKTLIPEEEIYFKFDTAGRSYELENKNIENNKRYARIVEIFPDGTKEFWIEGSVDDLLAKYLRGELFLYEH